MPRVKIDYIVSFSHEDPDHPASNLLQESATGRRWLAAAGSGSASVVLQLTRAVRFSSLTLGAHRTALVEVLVGRSESPQYEVLVPRCVLQSPAEARRGLTSDRVRTFNADQLAEKVRDKIWDRVRLVCSQPYDKHCKFGLSFVHMFEPEPEPEPPRSLSLLEPQRDSEEDDAFRPGALFAAHLQSSSGNTPTEPQTSGNQIRQATSMALKNISDTSAKLVKSPLSKDKALNKDSERRDRDHERSDRTDEISAESRNVRHSNLDDESADKKYSESDKTQEDTKPTSSGESSKTEKRTEKKEQDSDRAEKRRISPSRDQKESRKRQREATPRIDEDCDTDDEIEKFLQKQKKKEKVLEKSKAPYKKTQSNRSHGTERHNARDKQETQFMGDTNHQELNRANIEFSRGFLPAILDGLAFAIDDSVAKSGFDVKLIRRYVLAYGGEVVEDCSSANYLLCGAKAPCKPGAAPLRVDWLWRCHRRGRRARPARYLLA